MNNILYVMREIDTQLGGGCRVNATVGGAVGSVENEFAIEPTESILSVFVGQEVFVFYVTDEEWARRDAMVSDVVEYIGDALAVD